MSLKSQPDTHTNAFHFKPPRHGAADPSLRPPRLFSGASPRGASSPPVRSYKKSNNNAQGGQSRGTSGYVNASSDHNLASNAHSAGNGGHVQSTLHGVSKTQAPAAGHKQADISTQKSNRSIQKALSSQPTSMMSNDLPSTPPKGKGFPLQFGSMSPAFMNGTLVPPRTNSAPPNLDEQQREQAQRDALKAASAVPVPPAPKHLNGVSTKQQTIQEAHTDPKVKREVQLTSAPPPLQGQRPSLLLMAGKPMPVAFHQPTVPMQLGGPSPQIQTQGMATATLQMPMQLPLHMGNAPQVPQQVFVPGFQNHLLQAQGVIHQGQSLGFTPPPHQLGNIRMNVLPQFNQQQAGKIGNARKTVKITHPETHEELRLDDRNGGSPVSRPKHVGVPQSQSVPAYTSAHPVAYYSNSYASGPVFPVPNSFCLTSAQLSSTSEGPRFSYPVTQASPTMLLMNQPASNPSLNSKGGGLTYGIVEPPTPDLIGNVHNMLPTASSIPVSVKTTGGFAREKGDDSIAVEEVESQKLLKTSLEHVVRNDLEDDVDNSSRQLEPGFHHSALSAVGSGTFVATIVDVITKDTVIKSGATRDMQRKQEMKEYIQPVLQDSGDSSKVAVSGSTQVKTAHIPSGVQHAASVSMKKLAISDNAKSNGAADDDLGIENETGKDVHAKQSDNASERVVEEAGEKELHGVLQLDNPLKVVDCIKMVVEPSPREVESASSRGVNDKKIKQSLPSVHTIEGSKISALTMKLSDKECLSFEECDTSKSSTLGSEVASLSTNLLQVNVGQNEVMENVRPNLSSPVVPCFNKPSMEPGKTKNNKGKKKWKEILQKADSQGTTSDLYMAYKGPEEKKGAVVSTESPSDSNLKDAKPENGPKKGNDEKMKLELENWEDAANISAPRECENPFNDERGASKKKYSRDFLLTFSDQYNDLPEGFEITYDLVGSLMLSNVNASRGDREHPSPVRIIDRPSTAARRVNGTMGADRWGKLPGLHPSGLSPGLDLAYGGQVIGSRPGLGPNYAVRGQGPVPHAGGLLSGPMRYIGLQQNNPDTDRWQRVTYFNKGLMSSPQTPLQAMHKTENKYEVGKVTDEEQAKQRRLKAILNKLTPQNFEKLFEQVKEVNIDNAVSLTGVISQIFDKALMEPTFCEMYANFCYHLASELPDLSVDNEKITFKRLLLNKCQEEFERGEREEEEANKLDSDSETQQSEAEREQKRLQARRRMLGNIRLIGELYKKRMLTERIMHECIKKLLGQYQNPDEENIEALCKLMSTIGEMIDHPKAKDHMDAYFDIMGMLSNNKKLSSRVRFMLKDAIDLRKNKWQVRRKVEGPKKIDEVHRDAAKERRVQAGRLGRGPSINSAVRRGQPLEYGHRGSMLSLPSGQVSGFRGVPSTRARGYGVKDVRMDDSSIFENRALSVPWPQRSSGDESITLGPQGGLAKGMSFRGQPAVPSAPSVGTSSFYADPRRVIGVLNGYSSASDHGAHSSREDRFGRQNSEKFLMPCAHDQSHSQQLNSSNSISEIPSGRIHRSMLISPSTLEAGLSPTQNLSSEKVWPEELLRNKAIAAIKEYYSAKDEEEVALCIKDLNAPSFYSTVISIWVSDAFERKDKERDMLAKLLVSLAKPREGIFTQSQLSEGFVSVLTYLEDTVTDAPRAPEFLGHMFGKLISENVLPLKDVGRLIHEGGEEPGRLLETGLAADVLGSILEIIKSEKGESTMNEIRTNSNLQLKDFHPPNPIKSKKLEMFTV